MNEEFTNASLPYEAKPEFDALASFENVDDTNGEQARSLSNAMRVGIIAVEVFPPTSGFIRYGALALTELHTHSPIAGAAALGLSTLALEWGSYRAGVDWIAENKIGQVVDKIRLKFDGYRDDVKTRKESLDEKMPRLRPGRVIPNVPEIPENPEPGAKMPLWVQGGVGLEFGTVVLLSTKQEVDRTRTLEVNKRDGRIAVGMISGALAVQGALISSELGLLQEDTEKGIGVLGAALVAYGLWKYIGNRIKSKKDPSNLEGGNE